MGPNNWESEISIFDILNLDFVDELVVENTEGCNRVVAPLVCGVMVSKLYQGTGGPTYGSKTR
jgi:hypothetical protein